jgi:hypothetical protein
MFFARLSGLTILSVTFKERVRHMKPLKLFITLGLSFLSWMSPALASVFVRSGLEEGRFSVSKIAQRMLVPSINRCFYGEALDDRNPKNTGEVQALKGLNIEKPLVSTLNRPISVFNVADYGINTKFISELREYFFDLEWDYYLLRQKKIEHLIRHVPDILDKAQPILKKYYEGQLDDASLTPFLNYLTPSDVETFHRIKSHRRRSVASFNLFLDQKENVVLERFDTGSFEQKEASLAESTNDWKLIRRQFQEADQRVFSEGLQRLIKAISRDIFTFYPTLKSIGFVTHFTQIVAHLGDKTSSNAPEGVHQDGMDYIVSALVVDYDNAQGGKSIIYGSDKKTPLFQTILRPGYGIFQPDKGSDLWHTVEPIYPKELERPAHRSTLGFDFTLNF